MYDRTRLTGLGLFQVFIDFYFLMILELKFVKSKFVLKPTPEFIEKKNLRF
jgi:hypothetical protein